MIDVLSNGLLFALIIWYGEYKYQKGLKEGKHIGNIEERIETLKVNQPRNT